VRYGPSDAFVRTPLCDDDDDEEDEDDEDADDDGTMRSYSLFSCALARSISDACAWRASASVVWCCDVRPVLAVDAAEAHDERKHARV
jgi:hypothetical protein